MGSGRLSGLPLRPWTYRLSSGSLAFVFYTALEDSRWNREHLLHGGLEARERFRPFDHVWRGRLHAPIIISLRAIL